MFDKYENYGTTDEVLWLPTVVRKNPSFQKHTDIIRAQRLMFWRVPSKELFFGGNPIFLSLFYLLVLGVGTNAKGS